MLNEQTITILNSLKLFGMARGISERLANPGHGELSHADFVGLLVQDEKTYRDNQRLKRLLRKAKLRQPAALEDIDYAHARGLSKQVMLELANTQWIDAHRDVLVTGPTGIGKSYLACAIAQKACREGYSALYLRLPKLFSELSLAKGDGRYGKLLTGFARTNLLILDDWGLSKLNKEQQRDFLEIVEDRYEAGSTVITSQLPVTHWHEVIDDPTLADAILDRLVHNAYKINLKGDSMRKKKRKLT